MKSERSVACEVRLKGRKFELHLTHERVYYAPNRCETTIRIPTNAPRVHFVSEIDAVEFFSTIFDAEK